MQVCPQCSGFLSRMVKNPQGRGIISTPCECQSTETPGRVSSEGIVYPPEVITALQQASVAQRGALSMNQAPHPG